MNAENLFDALSIVYPTEENTEVSGPLSKLDLETWNTWVDYVGIYGGFGSELAENGKFVDQETLDKNLSRYLYGYHVAAGRSQVPGKSSLLKAAVPAVMWARCTVASSPTARPKRLNKSLQCELPAAMPEKC